MNSSADLHPNLYQPIPANGYPVMILAWAAVQFAIISVGIILRKVAFDYSDLRLGCFVMGILVVILGVANAFRISGDISENTYSTMRDLDFAIFTDLMVAITFDLGSRFYTFMRFNILYHLTIATTVFINGALIVGLVLQQFPATNSMGNAISLTMRVSWPAALFLAYWYAFHPVIYTKLESPSSVVAVGVWYLAGMGFILILHIITTCIAIPISSRNGGSMDIVFSAVSTFIRMFLLDFYSFPPSKSIILKMRNRWFPNSMGGQIGTSTYPMISTDFNYSGLLVNAPYKSYNCSEVGPISELPKIVVGYEYLKPGCK